MTYADNIASERTRLRNARGQFTTSLNNYITKPVQARLEAGQVRNSGGGFAFPVDCFTRLKRFLILGNEGGSYYAGEKAMTRESAQAVFDCAMSDVPRTQMMIRDISCGNRAIKNDPAIFAIALLASSKSHSTAGSYLPDLAYTLLPQVCRTGTHLFQFVDAVNKLRGWGRGLQRAVGTWYNDMDANRLAYQMAKYQQRDGWSHRDVLRLAHPAPASPVHRELYRYAVGKETLLDDWNPLTWNKQLRGMTSLDSICEFIKDHDVPRECIPTELLNTVSVWEAMLPKMPAHAMIRNLGKMSAVGVFDRETCRTVLSKLRDNDWLNQNHVNPFQLFMALDVYRSGHGVKGNLAWAPNRQVVSALEDAFYDSFRFAPPTGLRYLVAIDVSASMDISMIAGTHLTARDGACALAMQTFMTESNVSVHAFSDQFYEMMLDRDCRLPAFKEACQRFRYAATDCSLPMVYAVQQRKPVDVFIILTDSETNCNRIAPHVALQSYRAAMGINAKLVVVSMVVNRFTVADERDAGMLDVIGFDADAPSVISDFALTGY